MSDSGATEIAFGALTAKEKENYEPTDFLRTNEGYRFRKEYRAYLNRIRKCKYPNPGNAVNPIIRKVKFNDTTFLSTPAGQGFCTLTPIIVAMLKHPDITDSEKSSIMGSLIHLTDINNDNVDAYYICLVHIVLKCLVR